MPSDRCASDIDDQSVLGEEGPGAAVDTFFSGPDVLVPLPARGLPEIAAPDSVPVHHFGLGPVDAFRMPAGEALTREYQGRKWSADEALRAGMARIRGLIEPQLGEAHAGKLTPAQYSALAARIETEVCDIVANCKLEPKDNAMLDVLIADLDAGTRTMTGQNPTQCPALGLVNVAQSLDQHSGHPEQPGFKPIRNLH